MSLKPLTFDARGWLGLLTRCADIVCARWLVATSSREQARTGPYG